MRKAKARVEQPKLIFAPAAAADEPVCEQPAVDMTPAVAETSACTVLPLPASCTMRDAAALQAALRQVADEAAVTLDAAAVERVDTAAMQVLTAFMRTRVRAGAGTEWRGLNQDFLQAAQLLGLTAQLGIQSGPAG